MEAVNCFEAEFADISVDGNCVVIQRLSTEERANSKNVKVDFYKDKNLYEIDFFEYKKIYVCSREENEKSDVLICQIDKDQENEIDGEFITSLNNEVLSLIQYNFDDLYIDIRKNQYTGDKDYFIFLRKGFYKSINLSEQFFETNNILIRYF